MGLRGITLNTPPEEEAHIIAEDDAAIYQSIFGEDGVFTIGDRMKATVINNNQVRVSNGVICVGGHIARTVYGDYSDMTIENGEISKNRNDIITAVFSTTGEKGIDKFKIEVKKGTPGVVAEDPELTKENLYEGGKLRELPLWRVKLEGINIIGVEQMFKIIHKIPDLEEMIESLNGKITNGGKGYVCFPDGTQICYGTLSSTGYTSVNHNLIFAKPFIDTEYVVILTKGTNGKFITEFGEYDSSGNRNRSVDKCSVHYDATTANYTKTISWVAIGRWK